MAGAVGGSLMFLSLLGALAIVGSFVAAYAANCLLVVVSGTAAGNDKIVWPDEPTLDWIRGSFRLAGLAFVSLAPAGFLARMLRDVWLPGDPGWRFILLALPAFWLFFPVGMLSAMSAHSPLVVFRPAVLVQLLQLAPMAFGFFFITAVLQIASLTVFVAAVQQPALLPVAAMATAAAILIYARLLGRLAWSIGQVELPKGKKTKSVRKTRRLRASEVSDPWATPAEVEEGDFDPPVDFPVQGYEVAPENAIREEIKSSEPIRERATPYALSSVDTSPLQPPPGTTATVSDATLQRHINERTRTFYVPARPLLTGVYTFPWYASSLKAWLTLSLGGTAAGLIFLGMLHFRPL